MKQSRRLPFRIGHFPQYTANRKLREDLDWIKRQRPLSGGLTEMSKRQDDVQAVLGPSENLYRVFWEKHSGDPIEIPMFVNRVEATDFAFNYIPVSPGIPGVSFVKPRGLSILRYRHEGKRVAHIHTHWDAVLQDKETGQVFSRAKRVEFAKKNAMLLEAVATRLMKNRYTVFVSGDFNYRDFPWLDRFRLWRYSPHRIFRRLGLKWKEDRLDYLAWDPKRVKLMRYIIVRPGHEGNHGDHPYMIGDFAWAA